MRKSLVMAAALVLLIAVSAAVFAGCTENFSQKKIPTEYSQNVYSNGGLAVVYGKYVYFINGFAGETAENTFGKAVKGAVMRMELVEGVPSGTPETVVPKNVYGTDTSYGGLYIVDDYIYYTTPSTEKNSAGEAKTAEMKLMRTKVDGSDTEELATFPDQKTVFAVAGGNLMYVREDYLYSIDLSDKKFEAKKVEEKSILTNYKMVSGYIIYCMYVDSNTADYIVKAYSWAGGEPTVLITSEALRADKTASTTYTVSLLQAESTADTFTIYYTKTDSELNTPEVGICGYTFNKADLAFDRTKEVRFTNNTATTENLTFSNFYKTGDYFVGLADTKLVIFNSDGSLFRTLKKGSETEYVPTIITLSGSAKVKKLFTEGSDVTIWYEVSSVLYQLKLFSVGSNGKYTYEENNALKIFSASVDATYCGYEEINGVIYYFNSAVSNNIYYYALPAVTTASTDTAKGVLMGIITQEDFLAAF